MEEHDDNRVTYFARSNFRDDRRVFGIRQRDRFAHMYIIGQTGTGKSTLLESMARQDIANGTGFALFDPHGDLVGRVRSLAQKHAPKRLIDFDPAGGALPLSFNPFTGVVPGQRALAASFLLDAFKKLWPDFWGPRLEHILRNALLALLDYHGATLSDIPRLFDSREFRREVMERVNNPQVRRFWLQEFENYPPRLRAEAIAPIQNKVGAFLAHPMLQRVLDQPSGSFSLREVLDSGQIVLINLAKGTLGEDGASLLGALLLSGIGLAALSRTNQPESDRRDFIAYLDEFPTYATMSLASMLTELRKYRIGLVLAHQHLAQLDPLLRESILGNVGTTVSLRLGPTDAGLMAAIFNPEFTSRDLADLPNYEMYLRLMIEGSVSKSFSASTCRINSFPIDRVALFSKGAAQALAQADG